MGVCQSPSGFGYPSAPTPATGVIQFAPPTCRWLTGCRTVPHPWGSQGLRAPPTCRLPTGCRTPSPPPQGSQRGVCTPPTCRWPTGCRTAPRSCSGPAPLASAWGQARAVGSWTALRIRGSRRGWRRRRSYPARSYWWCLGTATTVTAGQGDGGGERGIVLMVSGDSDDGDRRAGGWGERGACTDGVWGQRRRWQAGRGMEGERGGSYWWCLGTATTVTAGQGDGGRERGLVLMVSGDSDDGDRRAGGWRGRGGSYWWCLGTATTVTGGQGDGGGERGLVLMVSGDSDDGDRRAGGWRGREGARTDGVWGQRRRWQPGRGMEGERGGSYWWCLGTATTVTGGQGDGGRERGLVLMVSGDSDDGDRRAGGWRGREGARTDGVWGQRRRWQPGRGMEGERGGSYWWCLGTATTVTAGQGDGGGERGLVLMVSGDSDDGDRRAGGWRGREGARTDGVWGQRRRWQAGRGMEGERGARTDGVWGQRRRWQPGRGMEGERGGS